MSAADKIKLEEGFEQFPYKCPADKLTIGYGFNLETTPMPAAVADLWLDILIDNIDNQLRFYAWYLKLNDARKAIIIDMCYQIGVSGVLAFKSMIKSIQEDDYFAAAEHMLDSRYARQTPNRAQRNAIGMRNGFL